MNALDFEKPIYELDDKIRELRKFAEESNINLADEIQKLQSRREALTREIFRKLTPWQRIQVARHPLRPTASDYLKLMAEDFLELHGDRAFRDDKAIICGFARMNGARMLVAAHEKGKTTREKITRNFGMAHPEGYRKALAKMKLAERFHLPVVTLVDTAGAFPGVGAEERGVAHAIAANLAEMAGLRTPTVCTVIGEGGSGGALGIGLADRLVMLEHSYYSVITPEGCSAILYKSADRQEEAATALKLTPPDLLELGIVDDVVPEPLGGAHRDVQAMAAAIKTCILKHISELSKLTPDELINARYERYRRIASFVEDAQKPRAGS